MNSKKGLTKKALAAVAAIAMTAGALQPGLSLTTENVVKAAGSDNYAKLLQQSLFFYDANMCGSNTDCLLTWRGACHTSDEVKGGYHDAGDHVMFGGPQGYSASTLGWSYYEFKDAYDSLGQTDHFKTVMSHFTEFFKASTKLDGSGNVTSFLYQKGEGGADHSYWGPPENQTGNRKMYWTSSSAADIAAEYAAALALNYINFKNEEDLKYAKALYSYSTRVNAVATEGVGGFYDNKSANDEQAWAAGWLYLATNQESYKNDCASKQDQYLGWVHGWENTALGAACVYAHITNDWSKVNGWIGSKATGSNYFFLDKWGSARLNCSMQFTALVASKNSSADYNSWCKGQMDYILGNNPANTCFVVGFASNSASKPHHRACSGTSTSEDNSPSKYVLVGALVGGPTDAGGSYKDDRNDYVCNEVALDYNAGLVGAAAGLYANYKTGSVESSIEGAKNNGTGAGSGSTGGGSSTTQPVQTQAPPQQTQPATTTKPSTGGGSSSTGNGGYTMKINKSYTPANMDDKMIGWAYADFGIKAGEKVTKVEVNISSSGKLGKWVGAFGSSTTVAADEYWTMTDEMEESFTGSSGKITWSVPSSTQGIIQTQYGGEVKFGTWWIDCGTFTVDSVTVYTDASGSGSSSGGSVTPTTTRPATTTKPSAGGGSSSSTGNGGYTMKINKSYTPADMDDKMIGWAYADFGIGAKEKVTKVEVNISSSGKLGKWVGAFGSSTTVAADEYWTMTDEMEESFTSTSGKITWNVPTSTQGIIQTQYGGEVKFGTWWIDCGTFTVDSVTIYTDGAGSSTPATTTKPATTTPKPVTTTKPAATQAPQQTNLKGDVDSNGTVNAADIAAMMQSMVGKKSLTSSGLKNADMNDDGKVSIVDLILLKNKLL